MMVNFSIDLWASLSDRLFPRASITDYQNVRGVTQQNFVVSWSGDKNHVFIVSNQGVSRVMLLLKPVMKALLASYWLLVGAHQPLVFRGLNPVTPVFASIVAWCSASAFRLPSFKDISHSGLRAPPTPVWSHFNWWHLQWPCFPGRSPPEVLRVWTSRYHFRGNNP